MHLEKWLDIPGDILSHRENPQSLIPEHNRLGSMALVDLQSFNSFAGLGVLKVESNSIKIQKFKFDYDSLILLK